jgi:hypothetical protein
MVVGRTKKKRGGGKKLTKMVPWGLVLANQLFSKSNPSSKLNRSRRGRRTRRSRRSGRSGRSGKTRRR